MVPEPRSVHRGLSLRGEYRPCSSYRDSNMVLAISRLAITSRFVLVWWNLITERGAVNERGLNVHNGSTGGWVIGLRTWASCCLTLKRQQLFTFHVGFHVPSWCDIDGLPGAIRCSKLPIRSGSITHLGTMNTSLEILSTWTYRIRGSAGACFHRIRDYVIYIDLTNCTYYIPRPWHSQLPYGIEHLYPFSIIESADPMVRTESLCQGSKGSVIPYSIPPIKSPNRGGWFDDANARHTSSNYNEKDETHIVEVGRLRSVPPEWFQLSTMIVSENPILLAWVRHINEVKNIMARF